MYTNTNSKIRDRVSEFTFLTPIKRGLVPGELRTFEERLRSILKSIEDRERTKIPTMIQAIPAIHFARLFILRPEQYLRFSYIKGLTDEGCADNGPGVGGMQTANGETENRFTAPTLPQTKIKPYDCDYNEIPLGVDGSSDEIENKPGNGENILPSWLIFTTNYDGDLKAYIKTFSFNAAEELDRVWSNCDGFPTGGTADFEAFWEYIRLHQVETSMFYAAYPHLTTIRIRQLEVFHKHFTAFVARTRAPDGRSVDGIGALFDEFVEQQLAYTDEFPGDGGIYDEEQFKRHAELKK